MSLTYGVMSKDLVSIGKMDSHALDAVGIVDSKFGVVICLDPLVNQTINDTKSIEFELNTVESTVLNLLVLFIEMVEELDLSVRERRTSNC